MAVVQVNPVGLASTADGYISSITVRIAGVPTALVPDVSGYITITGSPQAVTQLVALSKSAQLVSTP